MARYTEDVSRKLCDIVDILRQDVLAAESQVALFSGAALSYRFDTVLRPFPPSMYLDMEKNIDRLRGCIEKIPNLRKFLEDDCDEEVDSDVVELVHWCLCTLPFSLRSRDINEFVDWNDVPGIDYVFEFLPSEQTLRRFEESKPSPDSKVVRAYHGTRLENVFSILNCGLLAHMNKVGIFGSGTYLTTDLNVAVHFTNRIAVWQHCSMGSHLSCVAVCDVIADHPDTKWTENTSTKKSTEVPENYILVKNNSVLKLKYLLLHATKHSSPKRTVNQVRPEDIGLTRSLFQYLIGNKALLVLLIYILILLCINVPSSKPVKRLWSFFSLS